MSVLKLYQKQIILFSTFIIFILCGYSTVFAAPSVLSDEAASQALSLSRKIEAEKLVTEDLRFAEDIILVGQTASQRIRLLRHYTQGAITLSNNIDRNSLIKLYEKEVLESGTERDLLTFKLHKAALQNTDPSESFSEDKFSTELEKAAESSDWYISNNAWLMLALRNSRNFNHSLALQQAQTAYALIPNELSPYVVDARITTLEITTHLNNLMLDPERAIENTAKLISQKQVAGYPIDGMSLLNNLVYSLSKWREYEVSTKLAETIIRLEEAEGSHLPGLAESRIANLLFRQAKFNDAIPYIERGLKEATIPAIRQQLLYLEILALGGVENVEKAERQLLKFRNEFGDKVQVDTAKAIISISKKNTQEALKLNLLAQDAEIQHILQSFNANTAKMLASLESSKERQAEREAGLKREAVLKQAELDQQKNTNRLLVIVTALLALAAILALFFARFRNKVSKELAIKTAEAEDADRMKSEFLGMVSHELRTPLNGIVGIADLLAMTAPTDDMRHKAGIILESSNKLTHVVESIVDMSRIDGEKMELYPEPINVYDIVTDLDASWRPTLEEKGVTFTSFVENSLVDEVILDKARFQQCLNSLLSNAAKFTDEGRVHLHVTSKPADTDNQIEITAIVADTGQGMSEEVQGKLFTPFLQADSSMTRKHGGSGLGLAITQSLARMMGGDVTMISKQGRGSEFTMTVKGQKSESAQILDDIEDMMDSADMQLVETQPLEPMLNESADPQTEKGIPATQPIAPEYAPIQAVKYSNEKVDIDILAAPETSTPSVPAETSKSEYDAESLRGLKVLIVDDIPANQDVIKVFLNPEGCECHEALNGIEALNMLDTQVIDIILMDIRMPEMDGIEATRAIRNSDRDYKDVPIIALTADVTAETNAACMAAGADIFLTKPVMGRDLIESIKFIRRFQDYEDNTATNVA